MLNYIHRKGRPKILTRWWLKIREIEPILYKDGLKTAAHEFYVPWWAWPLETSYILFFGSTKIKEEAK